MVPFRLVAMLLHVVGFAGCASAPDYSDELASIDSRLAAMEGTPLEGPAAVRLLTDCASARFSLTDGTHWWTGTYSTLGQANQSANITVQPGGLDVRSTGGSGGAARMTEIVIPSDNLVAASARCYSLVGETQFTGISLVILRGGSPVAYGMARGVETVQASG